MPKKEMTPDEASLFLELKKLSKRANQRLLRLERLTGETETFASKQLYDYLSSDTIRGISKTNRIRVSKNFTPLQMKAIIKATTEFLESPLSTTGGVKKYANITVKKAGTSMTFSEINALYQVESDTSWIYEFVDPSTFWAIARHVVRNGLSEDYFIKELQKYAQGRIAIDGIYKMKLSNLYEYIQGMKV